ncbi:hypothetical protein ACWDOR_41770 [Streptosporangium canum]|uniref:hypothetical protein n=1 Tax=Streptosporangium canum TaxID=324952 RepID=UPI00342F86F8
MVDRFTHYASGMPWEIIGLIGLICVPVAFFSFLIFAWVKATQQKQVLRYTDPMRAMELTGRVRQLKVRGREEEAVRLVHEELGMEVDKARRWVKSI